MRTRKAFTLIELLTVAFIIAVLVAMMLPAVQGYRRRALVDRSNNAIRAIGQGLSSYKAEFGDFPPSEPDRVLWTDPDVKVFSSSSSSSNLTGFYGSAAAVLYLNGRLSAQGAPPGYKLRHDTTNWSGAGNVSYERERSWPARVQNVAVSSRQFSAPRGTGGWAAGGFLDSWGGEIEYFRAYRGRGDTAARIFPRAVDAALTATGPGGGDYRYVFPSGHIVGGYPIQVPATGWSNDLYSDYRAGWAHFAAPVNAGTYLLVSPGPDGQFGTDDDLGNW